MDEKATIPPCEACARRAEVRVTVHSVWLRERERRVLAEKMCKEKDAEIACLREDLRAVAVVLNIVPCNCYRDDELCARCLALARHGVQAVMKGGDADQ